jgi:hypothetical protein
MHSSPTNISIGSKFRRKLDRSPTNYGGDFIVILFIIVRIVFFIVVVIVISFGSMVSIIGKR